MKKKWDLTKYGKHIGFACCGASIANVFVKSDLVQINLVYAGSGFAMRYLGRWQTDSEDNGILFRCHAAQYDSCDLA